MVSSKKGRRWAEDPLQLEANKVRLPVLLLDIVVMRRQVVTYVYIPNQDHPDVHKTVAEALTQAMAVGAGRCVIARFVNDSRIEYLCIGDLEKLEGDSHG